MQKNKVADFIRSCVVTGKPVSCAGVCGCEGRGPTDRGRRPGCGDRRQTTFNRALPRSPELPPRAPPRGSDSPPRHERRCSHSLATAEAGASRRPPAWRPGARGRSIRSSERVCGVARRLRALGARARRPSRPPFGGRRRATSELHACEYQPPPGAQLSRLSYAGVLGSRVAYLKACRTPAYAATHREVQSTIGQEYASRLAYSGSAVFRRIDRVRG